MSSYHNGVKQSVWGIVEKYFKRTLHVNSVFKFFFLGGGVQERAALLRGIQFLKDWKPLDVPSYLPNMVPWMVSDKNCSNGEFKCANGNCIPESYRCDSDNDCYDNSDEELPLVDCETLECGVNQIRCNGTQQSRNRCIEPVSLLLIVHSVVSPQLLPWSFVSELSIFYLNEQYLNYLKIYILYPTFFTQIMYKFGMFPWKWRSKELKSKITNYLA